MRLVPRKSWGILLGQMADDEAPHGLAGSYMMGASWPEADDRFALFRTREGAGDALKRLKSDLGWPWPAARVVRLTLNIEIEE